MASNSVHQIAGLEDNLLIYLDLTMTPPSLGAVHFHSKSNIKSFEIIIIIIIVPSQRKERNGRQFI